MKAWVLEDINNMTLKEIDKPKLTFGDTLIKVKSAGICGSDIPRAYKSGAHKMPLTIGHEFAGEVVCAPGPKAHWMGKRVGIFPLIPCRKCAPCLSRHYEMCRDYNYIGSRCDGAFAEYVVVPGTNLIELPDNVTYRQAAMLEPMAVAVHAMRGVAIDSQSTILICGMGTIGLMLLMFLLEKYDAHNIFVIGNKDFQKETAISLGLATEHFLDSRDGAILTAKLAAINPDIYFECVGKNETIMQGVDITKPGGQVMLVGNPASDINLPQHVYWKILRNQLTLRGTWNSSFTNSPDDDWHYVLDAISNNRINPEPLITHEYDIDNLDKGFTLMRDKTKDYIKVMMISE